MPIITKTSLIALALTTFMGGCATSPERPASLASNAVIEKTAVNESEKANAIFEAMFMENVMASPIYQTILSIKTDYDKWDEQGEDADAQDLARTKRHLKQLTQIDASKLDNQASLSYRLLKQGLENDISDDKWRYHNYPVNQMYGGHSMLASFLINQHQVGSIKDANAYISRLNGIPRYLEQLENNLTIRVKKDIIAPKFVFPLVIFDSTNIITGAPFDSTEDSTLWADIKGKINSLDVEYSQKEALLEKAKQALLTQVKPAYNKLINFIRQLETKADNRDGVWKLPQGKQFYNHILASTTTTDMTADQIHELGLAEVDRIHQEMRGIMNKVGFKGDLQAFFIFMREDKQFYYPATHAGRDDYLHDAITLIDTMSSRLDEVFNLKAKASMIVKRVEKFREKSAGKAFYEQASPDGSRPGTYYANLYDMKAMPTYQMEALAYHEGTPGHHMQISIAQELSGIPKFRKFGHYTAYVEGWGLYSEYFPKEMGLYSDPYSDFGRLSMELWRSCRLVVDTGIHVRKWTREKSINYYVNNTPNAKSDAVKMVERHIVMPAQATAYKVGMLKILTLREKAKETLGNKFDIREFHTIVLKNGPLPLDVLEAQVNHWISLNH